MKLLNAIFAITVLSLASCDLAEELDEAIVDVSGRVSHDGNAVSGVIVLLVEDPENVDGITLANGSITDNSGRYIILAVDPGDYYVLGVDDRNDNLKYDPDSDRLGFHGVNPTAMDLIPDQITVGDQDLEDIDITSLYSL